VECFYLPKKVSDRLPNQLYISPDECINCGACLPVCPWQAIYDEPDVPKKFREDIALNAVCDKERSGFDQAQHREQPDPAPQQVKDNKTKWEL
jgi:ferredoxin